MKQQTTRDMVRELLAKTPWMEAAQMHAVIPGLRPTDAHVMYKRGMLLRREARRTPTNTPVYAFALNPEYVPYGRKVLVKQITPAHETVSAKTDGLDALVETLAAQLAGAIVASLVPKLKDGLAKALPALAAPVAQPPRMFEDGSAGDVILRPEPKVERVWHKRVGVVGLLPHQAGHISREFGQALDLEFPDRNDPRALKLAALHCDRIFGMTKFIPHSAEDNLANAGAKYRRVAGGLTELRAALTDYVKGEGK